MSFGPRRGLLFCEVRLFVMMLVQEIKRKCLKRLFRKFFRPCEGILLARFGQLVTAVRASRSSSGMCFEVVRVWTSESCDCDWRVS